ncbi:MAG: trypsin-like peptidase domain-containing protein [Patescibacteria group bacterium]
MPKSVTQIVKKVCPAVITIIITRDLPQIEGFYLMPVGGEKTAIPKMEKEKTKIGGGSGFIISQDGLILTSNHVVGESNAEYTVVLEHNLRYQAKILARDPIIDIAILKIDDKKLPYIKLGDSSKVELGQSVIAIGNPMGEFYDTVSTGVVSGLSRHITAYSGVNNYTARLRGLMQTDAAINPGNSGGPLVDMNGQVVAINTATVMGAQNIGFAIPINYAKKDLKEVKKYGKLKRPFLGVRYVLLNKEIATQNKLLVDYGALIVRESFGESAILKGSAACNAGLKEYDVILECEGKKIDEKNPLTEMLQEFEIGSSVNLLVLRDKEQIDVKVKLQERE